ncbi:protein madd-4-like [Sycon ciliatum]|uniref:protein madd-4-like n=1 Tax=Sycon ciliatum TaxID=27933 RepID=UPI0020AB2F1D
MLRAILLLLIAVSVAQAQIARTYRWRPRQWSTCSGSCGGKGFQQRQVECIEMLTGELVEARFCQSRRVMKPATSQACGFLDCPVTVTSRPGPCSRSCGSGILLPVTTCKQVMANGTEVTLTQTQCDAHDSGAFSNLEICNPQACPPEYVISPWQPCSKTCGTGTQRRKVACQVVRNGRERKLSLHRCRHHYKKREPTVRKCINEHPCPDNFYWKSQDWSPCLVTCQQHRKVRCFSDKDNAYVEETLCQHFNRPVELQRCINSGIYAWRVDKWGECSKTCGGGYRMRQVYCVNAFNNQPARSCPLCLKPKDSIACSQLPCPDSAGAQGPSQCREEPRYCRTLKRMSLCQLDESRQCCDSCPPEVWEAHDAQSKQAS